MSAPAKINLYDIMKNSIQDSNFSPLIDFVKTHGVEKLDDNVGNDDNIYNAANVEYNKRFAERHGYDEGIDKSVYDAANPSIDEYNKIAREDAVKSVANLWYKYANKNQIPSLSDD